MSTRRDFLKAAILAPASMGSVYAIAGSSSAPSAPKKWDMSYDVVVCGSGIAGMTAAISALDKGCSTVVLEMSENYGGCCYVNGGILGLEGGTRTQKANGEHDSPEAFYKRLIDPRKIERRKNDKSIARVYSQLLPTCQVWLEERDVKFAESYIKQGKGMDVQHQQSYHNVLWPEPGEARPKPDPSGEFITGMGVMIPLKNYYEKKGGKILMKHKLLDVYRDANGRVVGARVDSNGRILNIGAKKGVVLAGGSWKANKKLRKLTDPRFSDNMFSSGWPYVAPDGSAILAGLRVGAMYVADRGEDSGHLRMKFGTSRYNWAKNSKYGCPGIEIRGKRWADLIFTNKQGDRFVQEVDARDLGGYWFYDFALDQPEQIIWTIFDEPTAKKYRWSSIDEPVCEKGYAFKADTLRELARITNQPNLEKSVARYNSFVDKKKDEDFDKPASMLKTKIEKGPFYAVRCVLGVHNLSGGLWINADAQVLDLDGNAIPGLFAAGETSGGFYHSAVARCLVTGRLAGDHIAA